MILHTIVSMDDIFAAESKDETEYIETSYGFVGVVDSPEGKRIERLISTDPMLYLNPKFSPGSLYKK